jgi:assimilatory nitrate reductase catalytic subunit
MSFQPPVTYQVPADKRSQTIYFRAGNAAPEMIYLVLTRRGKPMRYFPVGAMGAIHVPLAVLEDIPHGSLVEILIAAPAGLKSSVLLDIGFLEIA